MKRTTLSLTLFLSGMMFISLVAAPAQADELLQTIQTDLATLGYDPGPATGELDMKTRLAIGKFEEANNLPVTGEPSFNLAVAISSQADAQRNGASTPTSAPETEAECLQRLAAQKETRQKRGQALRSLASTGANIANRFGGNLAVARDVMDVTQTADEMAVLANDLGLTPDEAARCAR